MNPLRRLTLWQATLLLMIPACPGDFTGGAESETTADPGACLGEPCDCTPLPGPTCAADLPGCSGSCALPSHACHGS